MPSIARTSRPSAGESVRLTLAHSGTVDGRLQVVVIQPGTANGYTFPEGVLRARAELFNGVPVFADHAKGPRSVRDLVGMLEGAAWSADLPGVRARLSLLQSAAWLRAVIAAGLEHPALVGLSADLWVQHEQQTVTDITEVNSVDIVLRPAAGGRFLAYRTPIPEETTMPSDQVHLTTNGPPIAACRPSWLMRRRGRALAALSSTTPAVTTLVLSGASCSSFAWRTRGCRKSCRTRCAPSLPPSPT